MTDILSLMALLLGVTLCIVTKRNQKLKKFKFIGVLLILIGIAIAAPSFISGFKEGFTASATSLN